MATLTQISNVFNVMVQQPNSGLFFYHFGYRYDINREISNNFDPKNSKGRQFPSLHMDVPNSFKDAKEPTFGLLDQQIEMVLYFDKLQDYDNEGKRDTRNTIEQMAYLNGVARDFMANYVDVLEYYGIGYIEGAVRYTPRSNLHNNKLITLEASFTLVTTLDCVDDANKIDLSSLPATVSETDIENWKA